MRILVWFWGMAVCFALLGCAKEAPPPPKPAVDETTLTPEQKQVRREARSLGAKLYSVGRKAEAAQMDTEKEQAILKPVYNDIEQFIFRRMDKYSHRISSITVSYFRPAVQCVIYVKPGDEDELQRLKRDADGLVGHMVENLPVVKYLMVKHEGAE